MDEAEELLKRRRYLNKAGAVAELGAEVDPQGP